MIKDESKNVILIEKRRGETMGELTRRVREEKNLHVEDKLTFAGRLDPMASGLVLFLSHEKRFLRDEYLALPKEYDFEIILGVKTDTGDALGLVEKTDDRQTIFNEADLLKILKEMKGEKEQTYPAYSSRRVGGKALFSYAREGKEIPVVKRVVEIFFLNHSKVIEIKKEDFLEDIYEQINSVKGDFRQKEIIEKWGESRMELPPHIKKIFCTVNCSSGTYVRTIAEEIGKKLNTIAIAHNIYRTSIGPFTKDGNIV